MRLQESGEMYLETIYVLSKKQEIVRSVDVAEEMGYSKPSVSRAVGILRQAGYLEMEDNGSLVLTLQGKSIAEKTYERHRVLTKFFEKIGVNPEIAVEDACKVEHILSEETFEKIKNLIF